MIIYVYRKKKNCGRQRLTRRYGLLKQTILQIFQKLPSKTFAWSILEYINPYILDTYVHTD